MGWSTEDAGDRSGLRVCPKFPDVNLGRDVSIEPVRCTFPPIARKPECRSVDWRDIATAAGRCRLAASALKRLSLADSGDWQPDRLASARRFVDGEDDLE